MSYTPLRVVCVDPIETDEGDLIVAGTPGTVLRWHREGPVGLLVDVIWDHYLHVEDDDSEPSRPATFHGLTAETQPSNLRWIRSETP